MSLRSGLGGFAAALAKRRPRSNHKEKVNRVGGGVKRELAGSGDQKKSAFKSQDRIPRPPSQLSLSRSSQHSSGVRKSQIGEPVLMQGDEQALLSEMKGYESMVLVSERTKDGLEVGAVNGRRSTAQ